MSQVKKILVAYDGSPHSKKALEWAIELSLLSCAQVAAVKVLDLSELYLLRGASEAFIQGLEEIRREDQKLMDEGESFPFIQTKEEGAAFNARCSLFLYK